MGEPRDPLDPTLLHRSFHLGQQLSELHKDECPASRDFKSIAFEVNSCHASYQIVRPYLQPQNHFLSETCLGLVWNIHNGVETICNSLYRDIRSLQEKIARASSAKERRFLNVHGGKLTASNYNKFCLRFIEEHDHSLERSQLQYAGLLLQLVLAVLAYAQYIHHAQSTAFPDHSDYLIRNLHTVLIDVQKRENERKAERRTSSLRVEVSRWWGDGYFAQHAFNGPLTPLAELCRHWVNAEARLAAQNIQDEYGYQEITRELRERCQRRGAVIQRLDADNRQLAATNGQLAAVNAQHSTRYERLQRENHRLNEMVDTLNHNISRLNSQIQSERAVHQEAAQEQENLISGYRAQRDRARARLSTSAAERTAAETDAHEARFARDQALHDLECMRRAQNRSNRRDSSSRPRTSSRSHERPAAAISNTTHRHRHSSRSSGSSNRWSETVTAVNDRDSHHSYRATSSRDPPPINLSTKPTWIDDVTRILHSRPRPYDYD